MKMVKINIEEEGSYYIGSHTALELLESNFEKPVFINCLVEYLKKGEHTEVAHYMRLGITKNTIFTIEKIAIEDIPCKRDRDETEYEMHPDGVKEIK